MKERAYCIHYPSEHSSRSCIRLCMCYCKPPTVFPGSRTYRTVVTRIFHAVTLKGCCLVGRGWSTNKCGSYVLVRKIR